MVHVDHSGRDAAAAFHFSTAPHILILEARFYDNINDHLVAGAIDVLEAAGATWERMVVPGALEIPAAMQFAALRTSGKPFDAFVAVGCVIRGETTHYDIVSMESARGITDIGLKHGLAVGNGILTVETIEQAMDRADPARQNKGGGAALAALTMLHLKHTNAPRGV